MNIKNQSDLIIPYLYFWGNSAAIKSNSDIAFKWLDE